MTRRRTQALLAICLVAVLGNLSTAQTHIASQLRSTHSVLTQNAQSPATLNLPQVQFQTGYPKPNRPSRRQITAAMESVLAPPASHQAHQASRLPSRSEAQNAHRNAWVQNEIGNQSASHPERYTLPQSGNSTENFARQTRMGYQTNPYSTDPIRQVTNTDIIENDALVPGNYGTPVYQDTDPTMPDPFGQLPANDFPIPATPTPLDVTQDPEDPFQQRPGTDPRSTTNPQPRTSPQPRTNPQPGTSPLPRTNSQQDPTDPFQQRPGTDPRNPTQPRTNPQDTSPRPLPNDLTDPTELPVPPRDRNVTPGGELDPPFDPSSQENDREPFIYPNEAYPGRQSYPGRTSAYERSQPAGRATPSNTSQTLYPPRQQQPFYYEQPMSVLPQLEGYENYDPNSGLPIQAGQAPFDQPGALGEYQQVIHGNYENQTVCREPDGWRPQLALVENTCEDICYDSCCFEPLFYLAAFGGFSSADDLTTAPQGTSVGFNMDRGASFGLALGQYQGQNLRTELEYAFRHNDIESLQLTESFGSEINLTSYNLSGEVKAHSGMANMIWQFNNMGGRWVNPYVGAGAGFVFLSADAERAGSKVFANGQDGNSSFAYQLFAGINTQLSSTMDVFVEYRHFAADELRLHTDLAAANAGNGVFAQSYDYASDNVHFGLRFKF